MDDSPFTYYNWLFAGSMDNNSSKSGCAGIKEIRIARVRFVSADSYKSLFEQYMDNSSTWFTGARPFNGENNNWPSGIS